MRYRLRTLLILLAILPPLLAVGWLKYAAWKAEQERRAAQAELEAVERLRAARLDVVDWYMGPVAADSIDQTAP